MLSGSFTMGGLTLIAAGIWQRNTAAMKAFMVLQGGWIATAGAALQLAAASQVYLTQPSTVISKLAENAFYHYLPSVWIGLVAIIAVLGLLAAARRGKATGWLATAAAVCGLLETAVLVIYRDGIRDMTLLASGYKVWDLKVVANWPIVSLFLIVFVAGLLMLGWMIFIAYKAKPNPEKVAP